MPGKDDDSGRVISIVNSEIDNLGGFLGEGPSQMVTNAALLIGSVAYMLIVEPMVALVGFAFLTPQIILAPLMQCKLNRLTEQRLHLMRKLGQKVPEIDDPTDEADLHVLPRIYGNRLRYFILKFALKAALNFLDALGPLAVLAFGGWMVIQGETTVGVIVAFITGFERVSNPVRELITFYRATQQARVQHDMIADWVSEGVGLSEDQGAKPDA